MPRINLETIKNKITSKKAIIALAVLAMIAAALASGIILQKEKPVEKPVPSISAGCDRVLWKGTELELTASARNIDNPLFNWTVDGKYAGSDRKLMQKLDIGEHRIGLDAAFDSMIITANQTTIMIDSAEGIALHDYAASKNQWGFQTRYNGRNFGVKGVMISIDSSPPSEVNDCGSLSTKPLFAGEHTWSAMFQGSVIASGKFSVKEVSELKIASIDIAPGYTAGDTVSGKIVLRNTGSTSITGFDIETLAVNNNFAWMGDAAKREYLDHYTSDIKPGETYEIQVSMTIPEKVSGIRPSGRYTITISPLLNGQKQDTKVVYTEVK